MRYYDEELLEAKRERERKKYTTLETGIYAGEELIEFTDIVLPDTAIHLPLPKCFFILPDMIKSVKYPSTYAPRSVMSSLDVTVNIAFDCLDIKNGDVKALSDQFQTALKNINPSITIRKREDVKTCQGNDMSWFGYNGCQLDGQSYNHVCLIKMKDTVLYVVFNCPLKEREKWETIIEKICMGISEEI